MKTSDFYFDLPQELIAQHPSGVRGQDKLMLLGRKDGSVTHHFMDDLPSLILPGTLMIFNNSKVRRARCYGIKETTGRETDFMFLDPPYDTEFSDYEGNAFTKLDQARLAVCLSKTKAKFLLIIKNTPFIEDLYSNGFYIRRFDKQYTYNVRSRNDRAAEHLIITNYPLPDENP